jgi:hypothetical protein
MSLSTMTANPIPLPSRRSQKQQKMPCAEWRGFVEMYRLAAKNFSDALEALPCTPGAEFNQVWQRAERARKSLDEARTALLWHEHDHDCTNRGEAFEA